MSQDPAATVADKESNNKGKRKRKREEMEEEEELLWEKLKGGEGVNRSKRQQQRLQQWKDTVAKTYQGCRAINERSIQRSCRKIFPVNMLNAINDIQRPHVSKGKQRKDSQSLQSSETNKMKQFWGKNLQKK